MTVFRQPTTDPESANLAAAFEIRDRQALRSTASLRERIYCPQQHPTTPAESQPHPTRKAIPQSIPKDLSSNLDIDDYDSGEPPPY